MEHKNKKKYSVRTSKRRRISDAVYVGTVALAFAAISGALVILPRSTVSLTEKRELASFPEFTAEEYFSGDYTEDIAEWFSDTVPYRDELTALSTSVKELFGFRQDGVRFHNVSLPTDTSDSPESSSSSDSPDTPESSSSSDSPDTSTSSSDGGGSSSSTSSSGTQILPADTDVGETAPDDHLNITNNGIAVVGTRALMLYGGSLAVSERYAEVINEYKAALPDVNVYCMIIPTSCEFYSPPSVAAYCGSELDNINYAYSFLENAVGVDVYSVLAAHLDEDIYLRTDHHWAPLGAYYAAQAFAEAAGVPFLNISEYEQHVVHDYVGTMYGYTGDVVLKNNPEDFVYYVPTTVEYTTTYYEYILEDGSIVGAKEPFDGKFFIKYPDGSSMAYCTFMGGDSEIVRVSTNAGTGRKLAILKDSYGNALPGYLFGSFDEIYVVDMRYFTHNAVDFFTENGVTDILFANNAFHAATSSTVTYYEELLTQEDWGFWQ